MPVATRKKIDTEAEDYLIDGVVEDDLDEDVLTEEDDENMDAVRSSALQSGWEAALKASNTSSRKYTNDFRFQDEPQLVKFLDSVPFAVFSQHWVQRTGKKSFNCIGVDCPLCAVGDAPRKKIAFSLVNLSAEEPVVEMLVASTNLAVRLNRLDEDPKTGPLDRMYWSLSKSGSGPQTVHNVLPVKPRDLTDDWGTEQAEVEAVVDRFEPLTEKVITFSTREELLKIAREISA
jgi:hypothetical protein